ncbi:MAG: FAD-dependent oxidoreductase [Opitutae bacterium]|nr:FAD-dependent oxidoreductase [Opitutae bacterium]
MENSQKEIYDAIVVGAGPAGLATAIYLARAKFSVLVIEKENIGGQITITDEVVNYPGVLRATGKELTGTMRRQAENFGAEFVAAEVRELDIAGAVKTVATSRGDFRAVGIVVATGAAPRRVGFKGEDDFRGHGVAYCATCDGEFFAGKELLVVGGGFAACEEALFLTRYATKIKLLVRRDAFSCAQSVVDKVAAEPKIETLFNTEILELRGGAAPESAILKNNRSGETKEFRAANGDTFGVFVFAGYSPESALLKGKIELDKDGYVVADSEGKTTVPAVYVAGDLRRKRLRQVVTAVSDGATAATALEKDLPEIKAREGISTKKIRVPATKADAASPADNNPPATDADAATIGGGEFFDEAARVQLSQLFARFERKIELAAELGDDAVSADLRRFLEEIASLSDNISLRFGAPVDAAESTTKPCVSICDASGKFLRARFCGVPGGHEVNSFVVSLYNAAGPGQDLDNDVKKRIAKIATKRRMQVLVSLSCTLCPAVVVATQRIAIENPNVVAEAIDIAHFPEIRDRYGVMSVPALVIDDKLVGFGKKSLPQLLDLLGA